MLIEGEEARLYAAIRLRGAMSAHLGRISKRVDRFHETYISLRAERDKVTADIQALRDKIKRMQDGRPARRSPKLFVEKRPMPNHGAVFYGNAQPRYGR